MTTILGITTHEIDNQMTTVDHKIQKAGKFLSTMLHINFKRYKNNIKLPSYHLQMFTWVSRTTPC